VPFSRPEPLRGKHSTDAFSCGEESIDVWLKRYARHAEAVGTARTFVTTDDGREIVGYYALTVGQVEPRNATERLLKGLPGGQPVGVAVLARLGVDLRHQGVRLGRSLLEDALLKVAGAAETMGIRALVAHALTEDAMRFYRRFGFESSPVDPLTVILLMKDLRALLKAAERPAAD